MNPYVFIVGCPRSGTTLLQRIVNAHAQIAITPETHWIARYFNARKGLTADGLVKPRLITKLLQYHKFAHLGIDRESLESLLASERPLSYAQFVSGIFDHYGRAQGKRLVGDKTPGYAREIPTLHCLWPGARFVHLIRDGRDVCLSALHWKTPGTLLTKFSIWSEDRVTTAALWWEWHVRLGREGKQLGPELYHEIRYESLVRQPAVECARLCAFLQVPFDDAMLRFHEHRTPADSGMDEKHPWRPITSGLRDWRMQMAPENVERFEAIAGELLDELGYAQGSSTLRGEARRHATLMRGRFSREIAAHCFRQTSSPWENCYP
jgi:hypothetical protein